jgi:hypothetical protein
MTLWTEWTLELGADDLLRGQGADPAVVRQRRPRLVAAAQAALAEGPALLRPAAEVCELPVTGLRHERLELSTGALTGPLVARHLAGAQRVAVAVCSVGAAVEEEVARLFESDPLRALALDGLGNAAVELLAQQVCGRIGEQARAQGLTASTPLSPGAEEWPVEVGQAQIFALLGGKPAGIRLTEGGMMLPKKSVSFVVGIGADMSQADLCEVCSLKDRCKYRHA